MERSAIIRPIVSDESSVRKPFAMSLCQCWRAKVLEDSPNWYSQLQLNIQHTRRTALQSIT